MKAILSFVQGNDTFLHCQQATGNLVYAALPYVFDVMRSSYLYFHFNVFEFCIFSGNCGSIVVCISPLTSLMLDQRAQYSRKGLNVEFVGEAQTDLCLASVNFGTTQNNEQDN